MSLLLAIVLVGFVAAQEHQCKPNEEWTECGSCEGTCLNPNPICTLQCRPPGCYCPTHKGFVRDVQGNCIPQAQCAPTQGLQTCAKNEIWRDCGTCEGSCQNPNPICTLECKPAGCYCPVHLGFVRGPSGACFAKGQCPASPVTEKRAEVCGKNEHWTDCGGCEEKCENPIKFCPAVCRQECQCNPEFVRGWDGECIKKSDCTAYPECAHTNCPAGTKCVWAPKWCVTTPCPQVACVPAEN